MSAANCPETPRQKMIGMMYLFLTAMLALNVSRSILNAFVVVNHSLEATNEAFGEKNEYAYNDFANKKANNPEKVKAYYDAAMKVKELSEGMEKYLLDLKAEVVAKTEKIPVEEAKKKRLKDIDAKDNFDIPTFILVGEKPDGSAGEARKLRNKLKEYKENLRKVLEDPAIQIPFKEKEIKSLGDFGVDTDDPKEKDPEHPEENFWETSKFEHTPLAAVVTMMSQIQNQIRNAEATVVNLLLNSISANDFKFDTLAAKVIPNSNYIIQGDKYEADLFVAAFSTTENPKILVGEGYDTVKNVLTGKIDSIPVEKGVGRLVRDATTTGTQKYAAIIKVKKPDGTYKDYPLIVNGKHVVEYTVAKPSAVISPTKMNVLYIGVDNPIDISVAGFSADKISAGISSGSLSRKGGSSYIARVRRAGKCRISVSATDDNGNTQYYENEVDNYKQDHFQLHWYETWNSAWNTHLAVHYTRGRGFFEQYREEDDFATYGLEPFTVNGELVETTDLIRRRWLDNDFYGTVFSATYNSENLELIMGGGYNEYKGDHFGEIIWAEYARNSEIRDRYYDDNSTKTDLNFYTKANYQLTDQWSLFGDVQYRGVSYQANGEDTGLVDDTFNFFNPKAGVTFDLNRNNNFYFSYARANREPNRNDYENGSPKPEKLNDFELGWRYVSPSFQLNTNVYYMRYKDQLVLTGGLNDVGAPLRSNVGDSYRLGLEIDANVTLSNSFKWRPNIALSDNRNLDYFFERDGELQDKDRRCLF